jgi:hypothetical protein
MQELPRSQTVVVTQVEQQRPLRPADLDIDSGITEDIVDEVAREGGIH